MLFNKEIINKGLVCKSIQVDCNYGFVIVAFACVVVLFCFVFKFLSSLSLG